MTEKHNKDLILKTDQEVIYDIKKTLNDALDYILYRLNDLKDIKQSYIKNCEVEFKNYFDYIDKDALNGTLLHYIKITRT